MAAPVAALLAVKAATTTEDGKIRPWVKWTAGSLAFLIFVFAVFTAAIIGALASISFGSESGCVGEATERQYQSEGELLEANPDADVCVLPSAAGKPGAWGGYSNGQIPLSALQELSWAPGHYLRPDAAAAAEAMNVAYKARFGVNMRVSDSYRDYAGQVAAKNNKGFLAATPGTSNHGWALAVDWGGGVERFGSEQHAWMVANAGTYGWVHPDWAKQNGSKPEAWHWEYYGGGTYSAPIAAAGDGSTPDSAKAIAHSLVGQYGWGEDEYQCLVSLWTKESGWRVDADNPSSSAYGIPQALPGSKMASAGADWQTNATTQITWGLGYIRDRYDTPCKAWAHSQAKNWY